MIKMLENFASTSAPTVPLKGQLWYDKTPARIKVYDGTSHLKKVEVHCSFQSTTW